MRRRLIEKFVAIIILMSVIVFTYMFYVNYLELEFNVKHKMQTAKELEHTQFIDHCDRIEPDWIKMFDKSLATLNFFESHLHELVTDVAVGTRIMEAQMNLLLKSELNLSEKIVQDLQTLQRKSKMIGDIIVHSYMNLSENGADGARLQTNLQWIRSASTWETPAIKQWKTLIESNANVNPALFLCTETSFGDKTDGCIFGTFENCAIPNYCIDFLWMDSHSGYLLTHQILFHYMIIQNNCFSGNNRIRYESRNLVEPKKFVGALCRRVLTEAMTIAISGYQDAHRDLFVEQILVCSLAGYNDFITRSWIDVILEWSGIGDVLGCYSSNLESLPTESAKRRVKRWDNVFRMGEQFCSVHMGALILGVIGQQLRYYLEMCYNV